MKRKIFAILPKSIGGRLTTNSLINGFIQNGCEVDVFDELFDKNLSDFLSKKYDLMVSYNFSGLKIKIDNGLITPCVNYFSDVIETKTAGDEWEKYLQYLDKNDVYTFYWDKELTKKENFKNFYYLPHFVDFEIYKDLNIAFEFDVMFAGRLDTDFRLDFFENLIEKLPNKKFAWYAIEKHYKDGIKRAKNPAKLAQTYQGFIDNEKDMANAINKSKIVFNMNSQGISSLNYRTFQTVACKKLLISDFRKELSLFDGNMPYYENIDDLVQKINYFLTDENAYISTIEKCYQIAKKNHNSKDNVKKILEKINI